jgi:signal transduction histidine kinase
VTPAPEWRARLFLFDPVTPVIDDLYFVRHLVHRGAPALYSAYLNRRIRSRVAHTERARLARELHDGLLQSLIALEMEIEVLRRSASDGALWETRLRFLRDRLRHDISDVRDLMIRLRLTEMRGDDVLRIIAELAGRLRRETDIDVRVSSTGSLLECAPRTCAHLARIVQEALTNVRKHSRARSVTITISTTRDGGRLSIADDGRGFGFRGRMTLEQLEATDLGPAAIKERARAIGGTLVIESRPGEGARIDVEWTKVGHV